MFQKILRFWRSLSPALMPRALWVAIHHLKLPAVQEGLWDPLLDVIRELLLFQPLATTEMHTQARAAGHSVCTSDSIERPFSEAPSACRCQGVQAVCNRRSV
jgi:hypothetical protein